MPISSDAAVRAALHGEHTVANARGLILRVLKTRAGLSRRGSCASLTALADGDLALADIPT